ncbi:hypothetical protein [Sphingomonas pseudosanguinis]|uniref:Uncharacterized protein n=1 Tax=Sphingomonas pseudosanguinis TaxID=413712 RepID=A0A7W6A6D7_9SPHN|nr:hypothetical protein [Sphingomonas pseudosanguinis]MBB3877999.1 hypothetical protein [Sphingomonas pseudosanguinis]MBN3537871.1 hypothetical protein [Sphingomonas pseudosanguinis]
MIAVDAAVPPGPVCRLGPDQRAIRRLADLPPTVRAALATAAGGNVSEVGSVFNATDVGGPAKGPTMRFIQGFKVGTLWLAWVEQGGIAHRYRVVGLREAGGGVMPVASVDGQRSLCATSRKMVGAKPVV